MAAQLEDRPVRPGFYQLELHKVVWEVPERYQDLSPIGTGAYGTVCSALDTVNNVRVALKKLARPFQSDTHSKRTYRELCYLKHMKHENIIGLLDVFTPQQSYTEFQDVYLVMHLMGSDLNNIIRQQALTDEHVQFLVYQILRGLKYVHSAGILHRDLKPSNIAVNEDCELRILDFGLARATDNEMTGYVATRYWRAPEIMLNWMHYGQQVDMWSVGCIMAELLTGQVLFPGTDHIDQLTRILAIVGTPDTEFLGKITSDTAKTYIESMPKYPRREFSTFFMGANPLAIDLLEKLLVMDPDRRLNAVEALAHPYFMDIWSVGCIMAELLTGLVLFPGTDYKDHLTRILQICGSPDAEFMSKIENDTARTYLASLPPYVKKDFQKFFLGAEPRAIDLLNLLLCVDPDRRPTAEEALQHPYLSKYHFPDDEPTCDRKYDDSFEKLNKDAEGWRKLVMKKLTPFSHPLPR